MPTFGFVLALCAIVGSALPNAVVIAIGDEGIVCPVSSKYKCVQSPPLRRIFKNTHAASQLYGSTGNVLRHELLQVRSNSTSPVPPLCGCTVRFVIWMLVAEDSRRGKIRHITSASACSALFIPTLRSCVFGAIVASLLRNLKCISYSSAV